MVITGHDLGHRNQRLQASIPWICLSARLLPARLSACTDDTPCVHDMAAYRSGDMALRSLWLRRLYSHREEPLMTKYLHHREVFMTKMCPSKLCQIIQ